MWIFGQRGRVDSILYFACQVSKTFLYTEAFAVADMYESMDFLLPFCRFSLDHLTSSHFPATPATIAGLTISDSAAEIRDDNTASRAASSAPSLRLDHRELWHIFSAVGTEMVVTKSGRHVYALHGQIALNYSICCFRRI